MASYDYKCSACEEVFERILKIADRDIPLSEPCPKCGKEGTISKLITGGHLGDPFALGRIKMDSGMKNVMEKVRRTPGAGHCKSRFEDL